MFELCADEVATGGFNAADGMSGRTHKFYEFNGVMTVPWVSLFPKNRMFDSTLGLPPCPSAHLGPLAPTL